MRQPHPRPQVDEPDWRQEFTVVHEELGKLQSSFEALSGRNRQLNASVAELEKTCKYQKALLASIREVLRVESNKEILPSLSVPS